MSADSKSPQFGEPLAPSARNEAFFSALQKRRSTAADLLGGPGPDQETLKKILEIGARVPDHRRVVPFRYILFEGDARVRFGDVLKAVYEKTPDATPERAEGERRRFERAPLVVAVVSSVDKAHKTPEWEQVLTAGAVCENILIACSAAGFAAQWLTEWYAFDDAVLDALGAGR